ncbi:MAG TPA: GspE/PulE family protein [Candidatus Paceibacterota bacterium]|nr:GspE/PulE family protein [Candidatus Paceibacterota bacterium]
MVYFNEDKEKKQVATLRQAEEEGLAQMLAHKYGITYIDLAGVPINTDALRLITEKDAREGSCAAFKIVGKKIAVAVLSPNKPETVKIISELKEKDYEPTLYMASNQSLEKAWERYKDLSFATETKAGTLDISNEQIEEILSHLHSITDITKQISDTASEQKVYRTSKILSIIVAGAISTKASDIHLEPEEEFARLRFRLDGVLVNVITFDKETYTPLLSRIKLLSNLKLNIKENAQDGRFSVKIFNNDIEIRTSILPGAYGESVVLRLLNPESIAVSLDDMGIPEKLMRLFENEISKPNGMILTTGPTGSGKTTTLYAFLKKVHKPEVKIITIEDPIEYHLPGIVQTQVENEKGYTFASGLRSTLRQDPDVIMVGEIRDAETADIAIQAALTGHLVFSTLHTNDAAGAFPRLTDLGINPKLIPSAVNVAIAQRLIRRVCNRCAKRIPIPENKRHLIDVIVGKIQKKGENVLQTAEMFQAIGCPDCNNTGYKGRVGIFEAIIIDKAIQDAVEIGAGDKEIALAAEPQNILTLQEDGIQKILGGLSTLDELERVVDLSLALPTEEQHKIA